MSHPEAFQGEKLPKNNTKVCPSNKFYWLMIPYLGSVLFERYLNRRLISKLLPQQPMDQRQFRKPESYGLT